MGFEYLFEYSHAYKRGEIQSLPPSAVENERAINLVKALEKHDSSINVNIRGFSRNSSHYCPFSGGGDIQLFVQAGIIAAVVTTAGESEHEPEPPVYRPSTPPLAADITPPKAHEMRCGSLENKVSGQQTEKEATLQLQANMILTCAT